MSIGSDVTVLVIDDDSSFSEMTSMFLEQVNDSFEVMVCNSGSEGVSYFTENDVDCIVCDYNMPGMDGLDVLEHIRGLSEVPFILFTGKGSEEVASEAISKGATDYLQKGGGKSDYEVLANRIEQYVEKHSLSDEKARIQEENNKLLNRVKDAFISLDDEFRVMHLNSYSVELLSIIAGEELEYEDIVGCVLWDEFPSLVGTEIDDEVSLALNEGG